MIIDLIREMEARDRAYFMEVSSSKAPFCSIFKDITDDGVFIALGINKQQYFPAFAKVRDYWNSKMEGHGADYIMCSARQLGKILRSPEDWVDIGYFLADATFQTFGNGSHQFVENAVPALIDSGICNSKQDLKLAVEALLETVNAYSRGEHTFEQIAQMMNQGKIRSLDEIRNFKVENPNPRRGILVADS